MATSALRRLCAAGRGAISRDAPMFCVDHCRLLRQELGKGIPVIGPALCYRVRTSAICAGAPRRRRKREPTVACALRVRSPAWWMRWVMWSVVSWELAEVGRVPDCDPARTEGASAGRGNGLGKTTVWLERCPECRASRLPGVAGASGRERVAAVLCGACRHCRAGVRVGAIWRRLIRRNARWRQWCCGSRRMGPADARTWRLRWSRGSRSLRHRRDLRAALRTPSPDWSQDGRLARTGAGFLVAAGGPAVRGRQRRRGDVVLSPAVDTRLASELDLRLVQIHSHDYRNPSQLQDGDVLIVGWELGAPTSRWRSARAPDRAVGERRRAYHLSQINRLTRRAHLPRGQVWLPPCAQSKHVRRSQDQAGASKMGMSIHEKSGRNPVHQTTLATSSTRPSSSTTQTILHCRRSSALAGRRRGT